MNPIQFNKPYITGKEKGYLEDLIIRSKFSGDGHYSKECTKLLTSLTKANSILLTTSCTHALEEIAILLNISAGDEIIMPSFTFTSTANAFVLRGAKIKFIDIRPDTMNMDENLIEEAISSKTKAIVTMHYAGVGCEMDTINQIAKENNLVIIEDAAQCVDAEYKNKVLGTIGDFGCYSFHDSKNIHCGEGGALLINNLEFNDRAETVREKGTNRSQYLKGEVDKYSWIDIGSSYLLSELNTCFLYAQLEELKTITAKRKNIWNRYFEGLKTLKEKEILDLPEVPNHCKHNAHIFYIKLQNKDERVRMINYLKEGGISAHFHYIPLHSSKAGQKFGEFVGIDNYTTIESERLLRLPLHMYLKDHDIENVIDKINDFYKI